VNKLQDVQLIYRRDRKNSGEFNVNLMPEVGGIEPEKNTYIICSKEYSYRDISIIAHYENNNKTVDSRQ